MICGEIKIYLECHYSISDRFIHHFFGHLKSNCVVWKDSFYVQSQVCVEGAVLPKNWEEELGGILSKGGDMQAAAEPLTSTDTILPESGVTILSVSVCHAADRQQDDCPNEIFMFFSVIRGRISPVSICMTSGRLTLSAGIMYVETRFCSIAINSLLLVLSFSYAACPLIHSLIR